MGRIMATIRHFVRASRIMPRVPGAGRGSAPSARGGRKVVSQVSGALFRAFCVAVLVAFPALLIPGIGPETAQVVTLLALALALVIFTEYNSACPSLIEFRDAKPYNRLRVLLLFFIVMFLTILVRMELMPTGFGMLIDALARRLGEVMDFPYSPVRLLVSALPAGLPAAHVAMVQAGAALVYCIGLLAIVCFFAAMAEIGRAHV